MEDYMAPVDELFYFDKVVWHQSSFCTRHYHNSFEIYYLKEGYCNYFIDNRSYDLEPGDLVLIPEGVIHKTMYKKEKHTRLLINCTSYYVPTSMRSIIPSMLYLYRNPSLSKQIEELMEKIAVEYETNDIYRTEALKCLTHELFFLLARNAGNRARVETGNIFVEETVNYIQQNYMNDISLSEMARMRAVSPEHLSRTFKKETGFGFSEYLTLVRLQKAEYMLRNEPGKSISEVAYATGFNDSNYFSDKFKRTYGITPSKMKKKISLLR